MREAAPIYRNVVQTEVKHLKDALLERGLVKVTKFDKQVNRGCSFVGFIQRNVYVDAIEAFANAIRGLEVPLRACKRAEKEIGVATEAKANEW